MTEALWGGVVVVVLAGVVVLFIVDALTEPSAGERAGALLLLLAGVTLGLEWWDPWLALSLGALALSVSFVGRRGRAVRS